MSSLTFESVKFKNFLSFGNVETSVNLADPGTTLIVGENLDSGGSSGAGKTTLISALSYGLYDKIPSGVSKDRLINQTNAKKNTTMEVEVEFKRGNTTYRVLRFRGERTGVQLFENDKDITPASVAEVNVKIEQLIGFSYSLFSQIILFNGNSVPFLDLPVSQQRDLIEELFCITLLSAKGAACKTVASETERALSLQKLLVQQQERQNDAHHKRLAEAEDRVKRWTVDHDQKLRQLQADLTKLAEIDFEGEEQLHAAIGELQTTVITCKSALDVARSKLKAKESEKPAGVTELALVTSQLKTKRRDHEKLLTELKHLRDAKCPYCLQSYADARKKIGDQEAAEVALVTSISADTEQEVKLTLAIGEELDKIEKATAELRAEVDAANLKAQAASVDLQELKSASTFSTAADLQRAKNSVSTTQNQLLKLSAETNPHLDALAALKLEGLTTVDYQAVNELTLLLEHQKFLVKLLMDKNSFIRKNIVSKTVPFLNKRIGYYTEKLTLPHVVLFQPDMTCEISQYGRVLDHGNLSNGEKKRLNLALCLAFRDVLTYLHQKVNILLTDEIDGGSLDSHCIDALIGLLKHKAWDDNISIYVISHRPEFEGRCDRNVVIRKEGGFSTLISQPED